MKASTIVTGQDLLTNLTDERKANDRTSQSGQRGVTIEGSFETDARFAKSVGRACVCSTASR